MKIIASLCIAASLMAGLPARAAEAEAAPAALPQVSAQVTFIYHKDMAAAEHFYGDVLGLPKTYDQGWVKMFRVTEHSIIGVVDGTRGYHKAPAATPSVMLSVETTDLEGWYKRLKDRGATFLKELDLERPGNGLVNSILVTDPAGYTVEFYRWKKTG
jgi:catechol 2,3-dioxygenase-like lactoylglutathione lyase family enzyme